MNEMRRGSLERSTLTVRIPDSKVALIIGKQGAHIEFLRHMTGCSLNMASEVVDVGKVFLNKDEHIFQGMRRTSRNAYC